ncbi:hypothetical protein [Micromonospora sp. C81]|uniref:hypothetical protein n=1 Tax=Micromonospora sp. C81 TaxID=2824881 RepID=UPI001B365C4C|nr:hypothetical protein [Micromonospora sp. C81]MBQ1040645.1 hypothetical protein [Micromonospora sp. C81]
MSWRRPRQGVDGITTVGGDVSGIVNTGDNAMVVKVDAPRRPTRVLPHEQMIRGLHGRRTYLLDEELPFVGPGPDHEADPVRLLARLSGPEPRGVLVTGAAGAGKTRTCFEVAARAAAAGWQVLHVMASPVVIVEDLAEDALGSSDRRVLLVLDYLDACPQLDLRALADEFLSKAKRSGTHVACLASARPGSLQGLNQRGVSWLFDQVVLRDDQMYRSVVADHIVHAIAPKAVLHWGESAMASTCGQRPIIALLIARAIEQRLAGGRPPHDTLTPRAPELRPWLQDALRRDLLAGAGTAGRGPLDMRAPTVQELACAVAISACPQPREAVETAVEAFLTTGDPSPYTGRHAVEALLSLGWLDDVEGHLVPVHDTVTDELLLQSVLPPPGRSIHEPSAEMLFAAVSGQSGSFALFTDHLRRIMADLSVPGRHREAEALERFCRAWIFRHRDRLGQMLSTSEKNGERALLTMVLDHPWRTALRQSWAQIGNPWLLRAESGLQATPFLAAALRSDGAPHVIVTEALSWLSRRSGQTDADHVIRALLTRTDLTDPQKQLLLDHATTWVRDHPGWPAAPEILSGLLMRDATPSERLEVARCALAWLTPRRSSEANKVLRRLLACTSLPQLIYEKAIDRAFDWVRANYENSAPFLTTLLQSHTLTEQQRKAARQAGIQWLDQNPSEPNRIPLIEALLAGEDIEESLDALWSHVSSLPESDADPMIIHRLLENHSIRGERARLITEKAFRWLDGAQDRNLRRLVLTSIMGREDLSPVHLDRLADEAMTLVDEALHPKFLTVMLNRGSFMNGEQSRRIIALALAHCRAHVGLKQKRFLVNALLRRRDLTAKDSREVIAVALNLLEADNGLKAGGLLTSLLERDDLTPTELDGTVARALRWLEEKVHLSSMRRYFLLRELLCRPDLPSSAVAACERHGRDWLAMAAPTDERAEVIRALIPYQSRA